MALQMPAEVAAAYRDGTALEPGSKAWQWCWTNLPSLITRHLTPAERLDPQVNPRHPYAQSSPPGVARQPRQDRLDAGYWQWRRLERMAFSDAR